MNRISLVVVTAVAVAVLAGGCATVKPKPQTFVLAGDVSTPASFTYVAPGDTGHVIGHQCASATNFEDIAVAAEVDVSDAGGKTIGLTTLQAGVLVAGDDPTTIIGATCVYKFSVKVPASSAFYGVHVGNVARGVVKYDRAKAKSGVSITVG
jgi:hypothetical protein